MLVTASDAVTPRKRLTLPVFSEQQCYGREDPPARDQSSPSSQGSGLSSQDADAFLA